MLLTLSPLPAEFGLVAEPVRVGALATAHTAVSQLATAQALLLPPDDWPVADLQDQPLRWEHLKLIQRARLAGLPLLAWGSGAALLGRAAGGQIATRHIQGPLQLDQAPPYDLHVTGEVCLYAPNMQVLAAVSGVPAYWTLPQATALIDPHPQPQTLRSLLDQLPAPLRLPASALEAIGGSEALALMLHDFYAQCRHDPLLAPTFAQVSNWPEHMKQVQRFWETMLGGGEDKPWRGNLNHIHAPLQVSGEQLGRWLTLFTGSAERHLSAQGAELIVAKAQQMGAKLGRKR